MSERVLDCHHNDITEIVDNRALLRWMRKWYNRQRYHRQYARRG